MVSNLLHPLRRFARQRRVARAALIVTLVSASAAVADAAAPDLSRIADGSVWRIHNRTAAPLADPTRAAVRLSSGPRDGIAWLVGSDFASGTIDVDLRGADEPGRSFVGIAFHGADDATFEAVYFRAFNFRSPDAARRAHAVQYIAPPVHTWEKLRTDSPGKFEAAVSPVPDPDNWFHARLVIDAREVRVFVNDAPTPCLVVPRLTERHSGLVGLWVGNGSRGDFANLKLAPAPELPR